jgi:hypothetical protein
MLKNHERSTNTGEGYKAKTSYTIGEKFKDKYNEEFEIIAYTDNNRDRVIKFLDGTVQFVKTVQIRNGKIWKLRKNNTLGVIITTFKGCSSHFMYHRWMNMIRRCYAEDHYGYKSYGGKGVTVEEHLLDFRNYIKFIESLDNYQLLVENPSEWQIDKDILTNRGINEYSRKTISIVRPSENLNEENERKKIPILQLTLDGTEIRTFTSISEAERITGVHRGNIARNVRGACNTAGGFVWREIKC